MPWRRRPAADLDLDLFWAGRKFGEVTCGENGGKNIWRERNGGKLKDLAGDIISASIFGGKY
jgi:hypothetical protein